MTEENKRAAIKQELEKANRERLQAETLLQLGARGYDGVISHAYYHAYHCVCALLLTMGLESKTHGGLLHLLTVHFVNSGRFDAELRGALAHLFTDRQDATYEAAAIYTEAMARRALDDSSRIADEVKRLLAKDGYLT